MSTRLATVSVLAVWLPALVAFASGPPEGGRRGDARSASLRLAWLDPTDAASGCGPAAREEATRILESVGVSVAWRPGQAGEAARRGEIRVIVLDRGVTAPNGAIVLGSTTSQPDALPFLWVHLPGLRAALGQGENPCRASFELQDRRRLGVAMGRVIAHEVVHTLAPALPHGTGLMARRFTRRDLTVPSLPMTSEVASVVRAASAGGGGPTAEAGSMALEYVPEPSQR